MHDTQKKQILLNTNKRWECTILNERYFSIFNSCNVTKLEGKYITPQIAKGLLERKNDFNIDYFKNSKKLIVDNIVLSFKTSEKGTTIKFKEYRDVNLGEIILTRIIGAIPVLIYRLTTNYYDDMAEQEIKNRELFNDIINDFETGDSRLMVYTPEEKGIHLDYIIAFSFLALLLFELISVFI